MVRRWQNYISIDPGHGLIRCWTTSDAAAHDGARLTSHFRGVIDRLNSVA